MYYKLNRNCYVHRMYRHLSLHITAKNRTEECVIILLANGANPNIKNDVSNSAIYTI